ncbi:hypothetical protein M5E06_13510 [Azospirillum sp. A1-3]|uniref:hypothetical protein n=1 Tax=Azospirillum sp. A1-3 TaxID=185874 RepID=UPI0020776A36|nr:hypothetical protein [Azospirillum sp. A1-3]MCM8735201.1 hypothetical protein [Azospirillum sp. A1-3]
MTQGRSATRAPDRGGGYEILAMVRKGQIAAMPVNDMPAQATFIAHLFGAAA